MDVKRICKSIDQLLKKIDFPSLWDEFHPFPFGLYTKKEVFFNSLFNYKVIKRPDFFYGNTAIRYENQWIAIWNIEDDTSDIEVLASSIVHEMFHCFQMEKQEDRYPNDFELLHSPKTVQYCNMRYIDSKLLVEAFKTPSLEILGYICFVRNSMLEMYPLATIHEFKAETIEGTAEYVASKALKILSEAKYFHLMKKYQTKLMSLKVQLDPRKRSYYSGVFFYHLLDSMNISFKKYVKTSIFHSILNQVKYKEFTFSINTKLKMFIKKQEEEKAILIKEFMLESSYIPFSSFIIGYDPMNMVLKDDLIFCKSFIHLSDGKEKKVFFQPILLKVLKKDSILVQGYYIQSRKQE